MGLIAARAIGYLAFGGIGGWAMSRMAASISDLESGDRIDHLTGLANREALAAAYRSAR